MLNLILIIVGVGFLVWLICVLPMPQPFKQIIIVIGTIIVIAACLQFFFNIDLLARMRALVR